MHGIESSEQLSFREIEVLKWWRIYPHSHKKDNSQNKTKISLNMANRKLVYYIFPKVYNLVFVRLL